MNNNINYRVSFTNNSGHLRIGDPLKSIPLIQVLEYCKNLPSTSPKGKSGAILAYVNNKSISISGDHYSDGVVFVDLDNCKEYSDLIFNNFEKICSIIPNIYAISFSYSHNLHFFVIDDTVKGSNAAKKYQEREVLWLAIISQAIKNTLGIDFRTIQTKEKPILDTHNSRINQQFFLNHTDYKVNPYVCGVNLNKKVIEKVKEEYPFLFKKDVLVNIIPNSFVAVSKNSHKFIESENKTLVDSNFFIQNESGYTARTLIVAAAYIHYERNIEDTIKYIHCTYSNDEEMISQLKSLVANNHIDKFYNTYVEQQLFPAVDDEVFLKQNEYLSNVLNLNQLTDKYNYVISNTNTGKTEWIKKLLKENDNLYVVQMNKALRDGKVQGVEEYAVSNHQKAENVERMFTTIDGFINNMRSIDLHQATIIIDEAHLLQRYLSIDGRYKLIEKMIECLIECNKVIFLSATPSQEINLFDFRVYKFTKKQSQNLHITLHPLNIVGKKGRKNEAVYKAIGEFIWNNADMNNKFIAFSDRNQHDYKDFAAMNENENKITLFNSNNIKDEKVQSILKYNKVLTPVVLSTQYLGCGDEIKNEKQFNVVFNIDEGFTADYIIQAIGRFRDAEDINLHLFYTRYKNNYMPLSDDDERFFEDCFSNLIIEEDGVDKLNIIAAKGIRMFDSNYNTYSDDVKAKIKMLKVANMLDYFNNISAVDVSIFNKLPYNEVTVNNAAEKKIQKVLGKYNRRNETELLKYILSFTLGQLKLMFSFDYNSQYQSYEDLLKDAVYNDKTDARKLLECINRMVKWNMDPNVMLKFFGDVHKANKVMKNFNNYISWKRGEVTMKEFDDSYSLETMEKMKMDFELIENIFTEDALEKRIDGVSQINCDFDFESLANIMLEAIGEKNEEKLFKYERFEDVKKNKIKSANNAKKKIIIENIETGEINEFETKGNCMKFLNISSATFIRFLKGTSKLNKKYKIETEA